VTRPAFYESKSTKLFLGGRDPLSAVLKYHLIVAIYYRRRLTALRQPGLGRNECCAWRDRRWWADERLLNAADRPAATDRRVSDVYAPRRARSKNDRRYRDHHADFRELLQQSGRGHYASPTLACAYGGRRESPPVWTFILKAVSHDRGGRDLTRAVRSATICMRMQQAVGALRDAVISFKAAASPRPAVERMVANYLAWREHKAVDVQHDWKQCSAAPRSAFQ